MSKWLSNRAFSGLLRRATRMASMKAAVQRELTEAFEARYGATYSDVDADWLIDALDYGVTDEAPEPADCDQIMEAAGYPLGSGR